MEKADKRFGLKIRLKPDSILALELNTQLKDEFCVLSRLLSWGLTQPNPDKKNFLNLGSASSPSCNFTGRPCWF